MEAINYIHFVFKKYMPYVVVINLFQECLYLNRYFCCLGKDKVIDLRINSELYTDNFKKYNRLDKELLLAIAGKYNLHIEKYTNGTEYIIIYLHNGDTDILLNSFDLLQSYFNVVNELSSFSVSKSQPNRNKKELYLYFNEKEKEEKNK